MYNESRVCKKSSPMSYKIEFTEHIVKELENRLGSERDAKIYRRLQYLDLKRRGYRQDQIGDILQVSSTQLTNWSKLFLSQGFNGLCYLQYEGRRSSKLDPHLERIKQYIKEQLTPTLAALQNWIKEELNIYIEQSWLSRWIKKNSIALTKRRA